MQDGYSPPHFVDELEGEGVELEPSDNESPNVNLNYSASPIATTDSREPPRQASAITSHPSRSPADPNQPTLYSQTPSVHASHLPASQFLAQPAQGEFSQGTAGFGGGSMHSFNELSLDTQQRKTGDNSVGDTMNEAQQKLPPISQSSQYTRQSGLPRQPQRVGSAPLAGAAVPVDRDSSGGHDSLANLSLANQSRTGPYQIQTPPVERQPQAAQPGGQLTRQLAEKVRSQAERLQKLEQYKNMCERRIAELAPGHPLPLRIEHLGNQELGRNTELAGRVQELIAKNEELQHKVRELENQGSNQLEGTLGRSNSQKLEIALKDKKELEQSLLKETLENEELKRYVQVVKEALSAKIEDLGFGDLLRSQSRKKDLKGKRPLNGKEIDLFVELARLKQHNESLKREKQRHDARSTELEERVLLLQESEGRLKGQLLQQQTKLEEQEQIYAKLQQEKNTLLDFVEENVENKEQVAQQMQYMQQEKEALMQEKLTREGAFRDMQSSLTELMEREKQLQNKQKSVERENESLQGQVASLNEQIRESDKKLLEAMQEISDLKKEVQSHSVELHTARNMAEEKSSQLNQLKEKSHLDKETLEKKLKFQEERSKEQERYQEEQEATTHEEIESLRRRLRVSEEKYAKARESLLKAERECFTKIEELERIANEREQLQVSKERLEGTLGQMQADLFTERTRAQKLQEMEQKYETAIQQLKELEREKYDLSQQLTALQDNFNDTNSQLRVVRQEVERSERRAMETERNKQHQVSQMKEAFLHKQKNHNEMLQQLGRLRREMASKDEQIETLTGEVKIYKQELQNMSRMDKRADRLANDYERREKEIRHYEQTMGELNQELEGVRGQLDGTQMESARLARENENLRERMRLLEQDIESMVRERSRASPVRGRGTSPSRKLRNNSPLREAKVPHQRHSSVYRNSGELLAGINACLETIREFIGKMKMQVRTSSEITGGFKELVERMQEKLSRRIIDSAEMEEAIYRIDEWLQGSLHEFERMMGMFPTREQPHRETRCLPYDNSLNERSGSALTKHNDRLSRRLTRKTSVEGAGVQHNESVMLGDGMQSRLNDLKKEKEELERWTHRIIESIPSPQLKNVCQSIIENYNTLLNLGADRGRIEQKLMNTESLYRLQIRKEKVGSASQEGTQLRKQVQSLREQFSNCKEQISMAEKKQGSLEDELRHIEDLERRRNNMSLETDKQLIKLKLEMQDMRSLMTEMNTSKEGAERLNEKLTEERKMLERELLNLRAQLASGGPRSSSPSYQPPSTAHNQVPSFGGNTPSQFNKGEFGDFLPRRNRMDVYNEPSARQIHSISESSRNQSPAAERMQKAIEDSRRAMSYFSPNMPQSYKPSVDHMRFPTLGANEAELESKYSQQSPLETRMRSHEPVEESESSASRTHLQDRLAHMQRAIKQHLGHKQEDSFH